MKLAVPPAQPSFFLKIRTRFAPALTLMALFFPGKCGQKRLRIYWVVHYRQPVITAGVNVARTPLTSKTGLVHSLCPASILGSARHQ